MHEIGRDLLWSGRFRLSNNLAARLNGLTDADFSEINTPSRWRSYQQQVRLIIRGHPSPILRIENYRYNSQTGSGEGMLTQVPTAVAGDRPGVSIGTKVSGSIGGAIESLLTAAFSDATVFPSHGLAGDAGVLDVPLTTRDPWADAVRLSGLSWRWLTVDATEAIIDVDGSGGAVVFSRPAEQVELAPDLAAIYQSAYEVIVTGARQVEDKSATTGTNINTAPRPKFKTTTEYRPGGTVFPSLGTSQTPILFEEKTIIYQYWDDASWSAYLPLFGNQLTSFLFEIQSQTQSGINPYGVPPTDLNTPLQTITIKRQPTGYLFPSVGTVMTLTEAEVIIESNLRKLLIKPVGVLFPALGTDATLAVEKLETLTSVAIPPGAQLTLPKKDANGQAQVYEPRPTLEPQQPIATRPLKTELLKGIAMLTPLNWVPILKKPLVVDFGFLPDQARAEFLAHRIAEREQRRRDQVLVDMPIPTEWLAGGWQPLSRCQIGGAVYLMDGCAISISDREAKFGFTGALVSGVTSTGLPQSFYQVEVGIDVDLVFEAVVSTATGVEIVAELVLERLDVAGGAVSGGITIMGTLGDDNLIGTAGDDTIYGVAGTDVIYGGDGCDRIFAGSPGSTNAGFSTQFGDAGDDVLTGGSPSPGDGLSGYNYLTGTNAVTKGVGEADTLIGGGAGSANTFYLGDATSCWYLSGSTDYAAIQNFDPNVDTIQLHGAVTDYAQTFSNGKVNLYHIGTGGAQDLIAQIDAAGLLDMDDPFAFNYV
jgi:RTX calcium-binding nonapeptide repeat (4 copies)